MEAAAAAAVVFRPPTSLSPPNPTTTIITAATTGRRPLPRLYRCNLVGKHPVLTRCHPPANHLSPTDESTPPNPNPGHPPPTNPASPPPAGMVFGVGPAGSWDSHSVGSPTINRYVTDDNERWLMWYHGAAAAGAAESVGLAVSNNGIHWERGAGPVADGDGAGQVLQLSDNWWAFDTHSVRPSEILIMSSAKLRGPSAVYWMYYTGFTLEGTGIAPHGDDTPVLKSLPGLAISQDGRHWARIEGEHHSGALLDCGEEGEWDSAFVAAPKVVYHSRGDLRMYYHSFDRERGQFVVGIARSRDGIKWVKLGKLMGGGAAGSFDEAGVRNAHVVREAGSEGGYLMAYEGVAADGQTSVGLAASPDGLKGWRRCSEEPVLKASDEKDAWDVRGVGAPCLVQMDGRDEWRLYYRGLGSSGSSGIGLAVSQGSKLSGFERLTGFHLL